MNGLVLNLAGALGFVGTVLALALAILWFSIRTIGPDDGADANEGSSASGKLESLTNDRRADG